MRPLTCEMCGSNNVIKQEGLFVCQICGTKYSIDEARKMMIEGSVDVSGSTVKIDHSKTVDNYITIAQSSYNVKNYAETESYCNKALELDLENYVAWVLKGKAAGRHSTIETPRIEESTKCFMKAIDYAPDDIVLSYKKLLQEEIRQITFSLISTSCNYFISNPSTENTTAIINLVLSSKTNAIQLFDACEADVSEYINEIAELIDNTVACAWPGILNRYNGVNEYPNRWLLQAFHAACYNCITLKKKAIEIDTYSPTNNIQRYQLLIWIAKQMIRANCWKYTYTWTEDNYPTKAWKEEYIDLIMFYHEKIKELDPEYQIPKRPSIRQINGEKV